MCARRSLHVAILAVALLSAAPAFPQASAERAQPETVDIGSYVAEAAQRFGIPEQWIYAVVRAESAGRISAVSPTGATGLMQLMPGTWSRQRTLFGLGTDPFDPRDNILAGTSYLREMYDKYGPSGFLAAYNAGPGRYEQWRDRGRPLPAETRAYVTSIATMLQSCSAPTVVIGASPVQPARAFWARSELFAARGDAGWPASGSVTAAASPSATPSPTVSSDSLFAPVPGSPSQ